MSVPIIGNGDLLTHYEIEKRRAGGTHGQMIGRGALIKPWIFQEAEQVLLVHIFKRAHHAVVGLRYCVKQPQAVDDAARCTRHRGVCALAPFQAACLAAG